MGVASHGLSLLEAIGGGLLQGVADIYPISGLGHGVLVGALPNGIGTDLAPADARSLYAVLHVGIAVALLAYYRRDWLHVLRGLAGALTRRGMGIERRWAALIVLAALPGCLGAGLLAGRLRRLFDQPRLAAVCLIGTGVLLLGTWWWRRSPRAGGMSGAHRARLSRVEQAEAFALELSTLSAGRALLLGVLPLGALVPGVSGVGLTLCTALLLGLTHEQAAHVALLLLTPVLLTWGLVDLPDLGAARYDDVRAPLIVAAAVAAVAAYLTAALLVRYFQRASLRPFGYYCALLGGLALVALSV